MRIGLMAQKSRLHIHFHGSSDGASEAMKEKQAGSASTKDKLDAM
jgi:hypothetical protein